MASEFTSDINVMDENILTLLQYWDMRGDFAKMGIFEENPDMQPILRHVIKRIFSTRNDGSIV